MYVNALGTQADLSAIGEHRAHRAIERRLDIGILEDDCCIFAAELERQCFDVGGGRAHDRGPGRRFTGESDRVDAAVCGQELARRTRAKAIDEIKNPGGHANIVHNLGKQPRTARRFLRRLGNDGIADGKGGRDFPAQQQQRQIPRRDDTDDAKRLGERVIERPFAIRRRGFEVLADHGPREIGKKAQIGAAARNIERAGL